LKSINKEYVIQREERPKDPVRLHTYDNIDCAWILRCNPPSLILREDSSSSEWRLVMMMESHL